jgi:hypothetical protein
LSFDLQAEHWDHLRTSNPIESVFATVRHRTVRTKGALSATTAKLMVFKLVAATAKTWRRLKGENQLPKVVRGIKFQNGIEVIEMPASRRLIDLVTQNSAQLGRHAPPGRAALPIRAVNNFRR